MKLVQKNGSKCSVAFVLCKCWFVANLTKIPVLIFQGGTLICSDDVIDSVWKNLESNTKGQGKFGQKIDFRSPAIVQHLLDLVTDEKVS